MSHADFPVGMPNCMHESIRSIGNDAAMVTVRSDEYWIASTQAPCFSCARFATVLGLLFPASSTICRGGEGPRRPVPAASDEIRYFQLIYVRQISAPILADIVPLHADYDVRHGCRYVMNHCERCGAGFSDAKLFDSRDGLFNPGRARPIEFRRCVGPIVATGRVAPVARSIAVSLDDLLARAAEAEPGMTGAARHAGRGGEEDRPAGLVAALRAFARLLGPLWRNPVGVVARDDSPAFRRRPCNER
jgi:hypothetical protein